MAYYNGKSLLDLPDLVLHDICSHMSDPFDLLYFGNTCTRLRRIASSSSLWWPMAFRFLEGLWLQMANSEECHPRAWLLDVLRKLASIKTGTLKKCEFSNNEEWKRVDSRKFRCLFGMMRLAYHRNKDDHPAVLYEQWLYDVGLYRRVNVQINFTYQNLVFDEGVILQLTDLGQAAERDLRRRKQPNKDPKYYLKRIATVESDWMEKLFPSGPHGTICPLLMCPFQNAETNEISSVQGLRICLSVTLARCLRRTYRSSYLPLKDIFFVIRDFCNHFITVVEKLRPRIEARFGSMSLRCLVLHIINENVYDEDNFLETVFYLNRIRLSAKEVLVEFSNSLKEHGGIDMIVDSIRTNIRHAMFDEINYVLFQDNVNNNTVTRINLTDSDLIGGDNYRQEMSSAAFVSEKGALVTWHLTGRMRF